MPPLLGDKRAAQLWVAHATPMQSDDTARFHVYYTLNDKRASDAKCHERGPGGSDAVRKCKIDALAPTPSETAAVRAWLNAAESDFVSRYCTVAWNAVHCKNAPVAATETLFGLLPGALSAHCKRTVCDKTGSIVRSRDGVPPSAHRHTLTQAPLQVPAGLAIDSVTGLHPTDYVRWSGKHMGKQQPRTAANGANPYATYTPQFEGDFSDSMYNPRPLFLGADSEYISFMPHCGYGGSMKYVAGTPMSSWCDSFDTIPTTVYFTVSEAYTSDVVYTSATYNFDDLMRVSGGDFHTDNGGNANSSVVFFLPSPDPDRFAVTWGRYYITLFVTYSPDALGASALVNSTMFAFYAAETYTNGMPSVDSDYTVTRPTLSMTIPSQEFLRPSHIKQRYGMYGAASAAGLVNGVVEFTDAEDHGRGLEVADIDAYTNMLGINAPKYAIVGDSTIVSRGETTLDIELALGLSGGATSYVYCLSYGKNGDYSGYTDAMEAFAANAMTGATAASDSVFKKGTSTVWSISYGGPEWMNDAGTQPLPQLTRVNNLLKHLTDAGITVTASSGDSGSYFLETECNNPEEQSDSSCVVNAYMGPNFPASSPYVLGVGASALSYSRMTGTVSEIACGVKEGNVITSGGGYSIAFPAPSWQVNALPKGNQTWRGIPDVSALGAWIFTVLNGTVQPLFGTSASSPIIASLITQLNADRIAANASMGSIRQISNLAYNMTKSPFMDVVWGDNCAGEPGPSPLSGNMAIYALSRCYQAGPGWDAVTGLGTPSFVAWSSYARTWNPAAFPGDDASSSGDGDKISTMHLIIGGAVALAIILGCLLLCAWRRSVRQRQRNTNGGGFAGANQQDPRVVYQAMPANYEPETQQQSRAGAAWN